MYIQDATNKFHLFKKGFNFTLFFFASWMKLILFGCTSSVPRKTVPTVLVKHFGTRVNTMTREAVKVRHKPNIRRLFDFVE